MFFSPFLLTFPHSLPSHHICNTQEMKSAVTSCHYKSSSFLWQFAAPCNACSANTSTPVLQEKTGWMHLATHKGRRFPAFCVSQLLAASCRLDLFLMIPLCEVCQLAFSLKVDPLPHPQVETSPIPLFLACFGTKRRIFFETKRAAPQKLVPGPTSLRWDYPWVGISHPLVLKKLPVCHLALCTDLTGENFQGCKFYFFSV